MSVITAIPAVSGRITLPRPLGVHGPLPVRSVGFEVLGPADHPAVAVLGGISAGRHAAASAADPVPGWWEPQVGRGRTIDPARWQVLGIDYLGADLPPGVPIPRVDTRDQADALAAVLDARGIGRLHALVGASYGGMVALAFAARHPERVARLVVISAAHEPHPMATALRWVQRRIVEEAREHGRPAQGLALARALAMTTYRTPEEFAGRFGAPWWVEDGRVRFAVQSYLESRGAAHARTHSAERFLCLSQSIDLHRVEPESITTPATLVTVGGDAVAPPWQVRQLAERLTGPCTLIELESRFGHDAFLKEDERIASILTRALEDAS